MPKPVKKAAKKKPSADPNRRAHQLMDAHLDKLSEGKWAEPATAPAVDPFEEQFKKRMAELGRKGGKASGAKRMEMPVEKRTEIALKAAQARWAKKR